MTNNMQFIPILNICLQLIICTSSLGMQKKHTNFSHINVDHDSHEIAKYFESYMCIIWIRERVN